MDKTGYSTDEATQTSDDTAQTDGATHVSDAVQTDSAPQADGATQTNTIDYLHLYTKQPKIKLLYTPHGYAEGMALGNLGYQMAYSATTLEDALAAQGAPHLLQLVMRGPDHREPESWVLYADGQRVAAGDGLWARACFERRADEFRDVLRAAVEAADLAPLTVREYHLLKTAAGVREVARHMHKR